MGKLGLFPETQTVVRRTPRSDREKTQFAFP